MKTKFNCNKEIGKHTEEYLHIPMWTCHTILICVGIVILPMLLLMFWNSNITENFITNFAKNENHEFDMAKIFTILVIPAIITTTYLCTKQEWGVATLLLILLFLILLCPMLAGVLVIILAIGLFCVDNRL
jgi:hypothetical protein